MTHIVAIYLISLKTAAITAVGALTFYARKNHKLPRSE